MPAAADLARLRSRVAALEGVGSEATAGAVPLDVPQIDTVLPWGGLALGCLHEVAGPRHGDGLPDGASTAFAAVLLGRLAAQAAKPVLWIGGGDEVYAPGLAALGLPPQRVVMVRPYRAAQALWAMEEGLRCRALAGVLTEAWRLDLTAARRLQLAARASGVPALLLNHGDATGVAVTRWRVGAVASRSVPALGVGGWTWRVELLRCRGRGVDDAGMVAAWEVEWDDEARGLRMVAPAGDRAAAPLARRAAG
ncbi:damage-inducible mutagenesis protein (ImuA-like) [Magnetospirillum sp. XM-1]|uniref:ImuA family protein n=1 Tax=Magnetospirillum sp. XM-1 TaxID=1663591 RepID=UPI00073DCB06|nr:hypothetical protein [Magnetospirillum sp. XM-1]CUW41629.1 damage-inducible mutagenesis protein (ImuA-like) [Magnetospirillum sp. XM-1]